jgi:hypothetical protein
LPLALREKEITTEPPQDLKIGGDLLGYGFGRVSGGVVSDSISFDSPQQYGDTSGNWLSRVLGLTKEKVKKGKTKLYNPESYSPELGAFISASSTGVGATGIIREPTLIEQAEIGKAQAMGSFEPLPEGIAPMGISEEIIRGGIDLGLGAYETYKKSEEKVSGSVKKWWGDRIKQFEDAIKENPELFTDETKQNIKDARKKLETGEELTILEQQLMNTPIKTVAELGVVGSINPFLLFGGVGASQQSEEIKEELIKSGKYLEKKGGVLQDIPDIEIRGKTISDAQWVRNLGLATEVTGKGVRGASELIPETSEDLLTFALFEKALTSKFIPKLVKSAGLKGFGGYETYGAFTEQGLTEEQRYGKFLTGGLAFLGSIPEDVVLARKVKYKLKGTEKSEVGELGIQEVTLDLGKTDINLKSPNELTLDIIKEPLKVKFIPSMKEVFTKRIDTLRLLSEKINLKESPKIPNTNKIQSDILKVVKQNDDIISGSFAQETLIKGSRKFKDLDILSNNPENLANLIKTKLGNEVKVKKVTITDSPLGKFDIYKVYDKKGKHIADIDPIRYAEEGFASLFEPVKVNGYNLLPPEIRLVSKTLQQARPLTKEKRAKVIKDISQLSGEKALEVDPALLRGYGIEKVKQKAMFDEKELLLTHGGKGIKEDYGEIVLKEGDFFSTPSESKGKVAYARKSRMGFGKDQETASFLDLLNPKERAKIEFYPKEKIVIIEKGKLGKEGVEIPNIRSTEIEAVTKIEKEQGTRKVVKEFRTIVEGEPIKILYVKKPEVKGKIKGKVSERVKEKIRKKQIKEKSKTRKDEADLKNFLEEIPRRTEKKIFRVPQTPKIRSDLPDNILREPVRDIRKEVAERVIPRQPPRIPDRDIPRIPPYVPERTPPRQPPRIPPYVPERTPPRQPPRMPPTEPPKQPPKLRYGKKVIVKSQKPAPSYDVYIKPPKKKKYMKVTKKPVGLQEARNLRNLLVDETTSRTAYLKPSKKKPSKMPYDVPPTYAQDTEYKMRRFKQKKGKRTPLKRGRIIERGSYLLDTPSERKQISIFKKMAELEKKRKMAQRERKKSRKSKKNLPVGLNFA